MQELSRHQLSRSAVSMSRRIHNFSALKRFAEVAGEDGDPTMQVQVMFARGHVERMPAEVERFKAFVRSLAPEERDEFKKRSYWALASIDLIHKARLYLANTWPLATAAAPFWLAVSWVERFNNALELGALTFAVVAAFGYRALCNDPYYSVGVEARGIMDEVFKNGG
ncbi:MAG: hypothetical protein N3H30_00685 [Candidatus Micrarchaeota archaeon]|nr:hypothetical protein [Candidatus Micrarchaeota archaeon]